MITPWLAVHRLAVHRLAVHRLAVHRLVVHRLVVHRLVVHRLVVHPASFPWLDVPAPCCRHPFSRRQTRTENLSEAQISGHAAMIVIADLEPRPGRSQSKVFACLVSSSRTVASWP